MIIVEQTRHLLTITGNVFNLLVAINCAVNFILYSSFSSKFRATFRRLIGFSAEAPPGATSAAALRPTPVAMTTVHAAARITGRGSSQWILYGLPAQQQQQQQQHQRRRMTWQIEYSELWTRKFVPRDVIETDFSLHEQKYDHNFIVRSRKPCCLKETARCRSCSFRFKVRRHHSLQV